MLELISNHAYKIIPRHVRKKIREMVFMVLDEVCDDYKGFLIMDSRHLLKTYFPVKLDEMQQFLDNEQERLERARVEEKRRIHTILGYIDDFLISELRLFSRYYLKVEYYQLPKDLMKQFLFKDFKKRLLNDDITEREEYEEHFRSVLSSRFKDCLKKLNNRVKELQKLQIKTSLREYIKDHIVLFIVTLLLSTFLLCYFMWFFSLPYLIRFSFETANIWIYPVIGTLIGIDIILILLLFCRN